jgi:hypothetical protein
VPDRRGEVAAVVADIRAHVNYLDLATTEDRKSANVVVTLVRKRDFKRTVRSVFGSEREVGSLLPQILPTVRAWVSQANASSAEGLAFPSEASLRFRCL